MLKVPAGTRVFLGAPANPASPELVRSISDIVGLVPDVVEAHFPQCYIPGITKDPGQVLILVVLPSFPIKETSTRISASISQLLPTGKHLDIWPMQSDDSLLDAVRQAECTIF